ncbi:MAG: hypothetical protein ACP5O6_08440 [Candidatus Baltobacteraceae bacterium]
MALDPKYLADEARVKSESAILEAQRRGVSVFFGDEAGRVFEKTYDGRLFASELQGSRLVRVRELI